MIKAVDPAAMITDVMVTEKTGGKSGALEPELIRALAVTVSNRAAAGVYADKSGPVLAETAARGGLRDRRAGRDPGRRGGRGRRCATRSRRATT